ncbi:hypothetical protein IW967_06050 [Alicyclobacillus mali]|uniref:TATA-box binding n=1 Tax=Alicyclobacillus mali (ex Roth et al. 2021) TaxID=1123961 RepID=A0ABS0F2A4_9BACL|nr:hypothetical protein [Alicyclobacillus mali (ex Roth et al. 2021)]MBF8377436.1 hypothetical protein [Alicyclobacillus mali (ex Roth et al. 2021)]MCL6487404.1 hypothetical protein [Alicyclobacillus mali (ex Roth et al. 2021)]
MSRIRIVPIFVTALLMLALLIGGWQAYQHYNLLNPLKQSLQSVAGVEKVDITTGSPDVVVIQLGPFQTLKDGDLQMTYDAISDEIEHKLGTNVSVRIGDAHEGPLTQLFEGAFELYIQQGIAKEDYTQMASDVARLAKSNHVAYRLTMDNSFIYLQLQKGPYYLYRVIPYASRAGGATA